MKKNKDQSQVWLFQFTLESENGSLINTKKANELMYHIIEWAENNDCQVGGGYRSPKKAGFDGDIFELK